MRETSIGGAEVTVKQWEESEPGVGTRGSGVDKERRGWKEQDKVRWKGLKPSFLAWSVFTIGASLPLY